MKLKTIELNFIKKIFVLLFLLIYTATVNPSIADGFGSYGLYRGYQDSGNINYRAYALNQSLNNKKRQANLIRQRNAYYANPTRNIRYPNGYNQYPNIQRNSYQNSYRTRRNYGSYRYY